MELSPKKIPILAPLRSENDLKIWKQQVHDLFQFYGLEKPVHYSAARKRPVDSPTQDAMLLGLLSGSVSPVADRLVRTGWDFKDPTLEPEDLYRHVISVIVPVDRIPEVVKSMVGDFVTMASPSKTTLRGYLSEMKRIKNRLDDIGCPMHDGMAVSIVLNDLEVHFGEFRQHMLNLMSAGDLSWVRLMDSLANEAARRLVI